MSDKKPPSIFKKALEAGAALLDAEIAKARSQVMNKEVDDDVFYAKAITEDPSYQIYASGWKEKPHRLQDGHLKQISLTDSCIAAAIQTRQNQIAAHSKLVKSDREKGWKMCIRNEEELLEEIKKELLAEMEASNLQLTDESTPSEEEAPIAKADTDTVPDSDVNIETEEGVSDPDASSKSDDEVEEYNFELERKAREKLEAKFKNEKKRAEEYLMNCGIVDNRPFETKRWTFDAALRAMIRDSMTYDRYAVEVVPDRAGRPHHWFPVDGSTIKFANNRLKDYKQLAENFLNLDLLYPDSKTHAIERQKVLDLKPELLEKDMYKFVQIIRGKIERAYTPDELKVGIRNITTDIYNNGYGVSELELVVSLVTGHLNAEYYNQAYFTQGFSAKGILHIKAAINRRKLETVRQQWQHMLKGARNAFQTPIFAGMEDVSWIPLTQNHNDIGFEGWMRYLIKMMCAIYQIDPFEIGIGFKDEGAGGSGLSGDNTKEKMDHSKDKGLYPLLQHVQDFLNENILKPFDDRFVMKFTGVSTETQKDAVARQDIERKFKKTVNEVRAEDGLPPLPGMDDFIAGPEYATWYGAFSKKALENQAKQQQAQAGMPGQEPGAQAEDADTGVDEEGMPKDSMYSDDNLESSLMSPEEETTKSTSIKKSKRIKVEYYTLKE